MCGIAAILLHPRERPPQVWRAMRENFTGNLLANEERGKTATGLLVMRADGTVTLLKRPLPARQFVALPEYAAALEGVDSQTVLLLGHTRHPTKGDPAWPDNNHPVQAGPVFGVHNGHIQNDDALFAQLGLPRQAQVDSEIIFRLLERVSPQEADERYLPALCPSLRLLEGKFTFIAADRRAPHRLVVLRHRNPLSVHWQAEWGALLFSSRYLFLRKAFGRAVRYEALPHDHLLLFDARRLPDCPLQPVASCPLD